MGCLPNVVGGSRGPSEEVATKKQTVVVPMQPVRRQQYVFARNTPSSRAQRQSRGNGEEQVRLRSTAAQGDIIARNGGCHGAVDFRKSLVR